MSMLASVTRRADRPARVAGVCPVAVGLVALAPGRVAAGSLGAGWSGAGQDHLLGDDRVARMTLHQHADALAQLVDERRWPGDPRVLTEAEHPGDELAGVGVRGDEQAITGIVVLGGGPHLAVAAEVTFDLPGDPAADPDLGDADRLTELPVNPVGVGA